MTINGPAPTVLAMFLNTVIDQQLDRFEETHGRRPTDAEAAAVRAEALSTVRGTVQADVLKEDQGQNTCIFSTEFALRLMADVQEWFVAEQVRNFYSVSISGYHIAEAGANPISQLAFTLSNGFTYIESYLARGMDIDDFAPNLSFFFSNGMDPEYTVLGRVARRLWAVAMRDRYGANERSQKLKYHVQTSGRSLHAQEMDFNDIRTTLQALIAVYDNCNSLHTNAFDEAVTTPTEASVRRAMAIQLIINREWGLATNENPNQGSYVLEELTDLVEEAVLLEFERISERGGVLGAMELGYQRGRIQDESMLYEQRKHDGSLPIVGVNTFTREVPVDERAGGARAGPLHRGGEAPPAGSPRRVPHHPRRGPHRGAGPGAGGGAGRRQRVRRADGRGAFVQPRGDHRRPVRGRRTLSAQRVSGSGRARAAGTVGRVADGSLGFDPIAEARRQWVAHGWADAADGMEVVTSVMRVQQLLLAAVDEVLEPFGLTFARFELLALLSFTKEGALPLGKIGARLQVHPTSVTNAVDRLEREGLVRRSAHPTDRRAILATITPEGRDLAGRAGDALNRQIFEALPLDDGELDGVTRSLRRLRSAAGDPDASGRALDR